MPVLTVFDSQGPASSVRPATALQPGPLSQLITPTHDSNAAAAPPLPAAVAPALAKLSVQTLPTLQNPSLQDPDLSTQLQPLSHPSMVSNMSAVGSMLVVRLSQVISLLAALLLCPIECSSVSCRGVSAFCGLLCV